MVPSTYTESADNINKCIIHSTVILLVSLSCHQFRYQKLWRERGEKGHLDKGH